MFRLQMEKSMAHQSSGQFDLADSLLGNNQKLNRRLDKINQLVDWKPFEEKPGPNLLLASWKTESPGTSAL